jgi:hypothetical protein
VSRPAVEPTQPPGALSSEVKRLERESDGSRASSAEVKNERTYTSASAYEYATMVCRGTVTAFKFICLVKNFNPICHKQCGRPFCLVQRLFPSWPSTRPNLQALFQTEGLSTMHVRMKITGLM